MEKMTLTRSEAAKALQVSLPVLDAYLRRTNNPLPCIRLTAQGKRGKILIPVEGLSRWIEEEAARNAGKAFAR